MIRQNMILEILYEGSKIYTKNTRWHRLGGPAMKFSDGYVAYWVAGNRHRLDGPAEIWPNGSAEYYVINGVEISKEDFYENYYQEKHDSTRL